MSKRWPREADYYDRTGKRLKKQKHLYLVLDNWSKGYTIHWIDVGDWDSSPDLDMEPAAVLWVVSPEPAFPMKFAALGGNISMASNQDRAMLVYDTETAGLASGPASQSCCSMAFRHLWSPALTCSCTR